MNDILIIIGFILLLYFLNENIENFQLILPDFTKSIYTGKINNQNLQNTVIVREKNEIKPSPVEDVKQPPYSRFIKNESSSIQESPEDIREIKNKLDIIKQETDYSATIDLTSKRNNIDSMAICGENRKKVKNLNFKTAWRKNNQDNPYMKIFERYIIEKFAPENCFYTYQRDNEEKGCGLLPNDCVNSYHASQFTIENPSMPWMSSDSLDSNAATRQLFIECTGYDPENDTVINPNLNLENTLCRRLCCENLLFPVGSTDDQTQQQIDEQTDSASSDIVELSDIEIYKDYLQRLYNNIKNNDDIGYIESDYPIISGQLL